MMGMWLILVLISALISIVKQRVVNYIFRIFQLPEINKSLAPVLLVEKFLRQNLLAFVTVF